MLVTGGAGYLGSVLSRLLLAQGYKVRVLDSLMYGGDSILNLYQENEFDFIRGDIRCVKTVDRALDSVDAVVHLAAIVGDPACARNPDEARAINSTSALNVFQSVQSSGASKFIFASTCSNYGRMQNPLDYVDEDSELRPLSVYAESKVSVENSLLTSAGTDELSVTVLRFATLYGLSPRMRFDLTVNEFTLELLIKQQLTIYGAQFWRPYIHVRDAAQAILLILKSSSDKVNGRVFNVGSTSENYQKNKLVELIREELKMDFKIEEIEQVDDPRDYKVSFQKIKNELEYNTSLTVSDGIREITDVISNGVITDYDSPLRRN